MDEAERLESMNSENWVRLWMNEEGKKVTAKFGARGSYVRIAGRSLTFLHQPRSWSVRVFLACAVTLQLFSASRSGLADNDVRS